MIRRLFFFYLLSFTFSGVNAAVPDSLPATPTFKTYIAYNYEQDFLFGKHKDNSPDSSLVGIDRINIALSEHYNYLGTNGSAANPQVFTNNISPYSHIINRSYDLQLLKQADIASYRLNKRFTELKYHSSAFKEQQVSVFHSQDILKNWNAGLIFERQGVKDFMNYSDTYKSKFALFTSFNSLSKRYYLFANIIWNTIKNDVNGGLTSDSLFDNTTVTNLGIKGLAYNITGAQERRRNRSMFLSQYFKLNGSKNDSTDRYKGLDLFLHHSIGFEKNSFAYLDPETDSAYFSNFYYGSATNDTVGVKELKNRLEIILKKDSASGKKMFDNWSTGFFVENIESNYFQKNDSSWNNWAIGARMSLNPDSNFAGLYVDGKYVLKGQDEKNHEINAHFFSPQFLFGRLGISLNESQTSPDFYFRSYYSNNFIWTNDLERIKTFKGTVAYDLSKYNLSLSAGITQIANYTFLNEAAYPDQFGGKLKVTSLTLKKDFQFRKWHFNNTVNYQKTDKENILHIPELVSDQTLYYEDAFFRSALKLALGASLNYNNAYYADAFMPSNGLFYLQNEKKTGGYARIDIFANAKIKTARIFFCIENAFDDVIKKSYYLVPHYPMPGRVLKFGVVWRFFDQ